MRRGGSWAWLAVLAAGAVLYVVVLRTLVSTQNPNFLPSLILLGSAVVPASVLTYAGWSRKGAVVRFDLVALVVVVGGVVGTVSAGILEYDAMKDLGFLPMIGVGLIEETAKLLVPLAPAGHVAWTGLAAAALWRLAGAPNGRNTALFLGVFAAVVCLHGAWDGFDGLAPKIIVGVLGFAALLWVIRRGRRPGRAAEQVS